MFWIAPLLFSLAIVLWFLSQRQQDDIVRFFQLSIALISFMIALVSAHWIVNAVILVGLMVYPTCSRRDRRILKPDCSPVCLLRSRCKSTETDRLAEAETLD